MRAHCCIFRVFAKWLESPSQICGKVALEALKHIPGRDGALTTPQCLLVSSSLSHLNGRPYQRMLNPAENLLLSLKLLSYRQMWEMQVVLSFRTVERLEQQESLWANCKRTYSLAFALHFSCGCTGLDKITLRKTLGLKIIIMLQYTYFVAAFI